MPKSEIINHLARRGLGLKRKSVVLSSSRPEWPEAFAFVENTILQALPDHEMHIEHTGSTSVPGLAAKPVIDILLVMKNKTSLRPAIPILESLGFEYKGDGVALVQQCPPDPERHFFSFYNDDQDKDFIHLHMYAEGHPDIERLIGFRNRLRNNDQLRNDYESLKQRLWKEGYIRREFTRAKGEFIANALKNQQVEL